MFGVILWCMAEQVKTPRIIRPQAGGQEMFVSSSADVVFFGGSLGGGKTAGAILASAEPAKDPLYRAVYFRRTLGELKGAGGVVDEFENLYGDAVTVTKSENPRITFKESGAWLECRQIADENPKEKTMKKLISIVLCAVMGLSMAACGGSSASASAKEYNLDDIVSAVEAVNPVSNPREVDDLLWKTNSC